MPDPPADRVCPRCRSVLPAGAFGGICPRCLFLDGPDDLPASTVLGGHEILGTLGRGGMGVVYRARHLRLGREVALKVLPSGRPDAAARFEREARALARLDHENIVRVHDFGEEQGEFYIAMELVEGRTLREELAGGPLPVERARAVAGAVCRALAAAHQRGVIHRDIKPENVLLGNDGSVKVADFGITRLLGADADDRLTRTGALVGTPHYVAPERLAHPAAADHRVDLYAVGVLLYEMLTGHVPSGAAGLPGTALDGVLRRALQADPAKRYGSAEEMARDLEAGRRSLEFPELLWQAGVAVLIAVAFAAAALTAARCLTPRVEEARPASPLEYAEPLPDGRWVSWV